MKASKTFVAPFNEDLTDPNSTHKRIGTFTSTIDVEDQEEGTEAVLRTLLDMAAYYLNSPHSSLLLVETE